MKSSVPQRGRLQTTAPSSDQCTVFTHRSRSEYPSNSYVGVTANNSWSHKNISKTATTATSDQNTAYHRIGPIRSTANTTRTGLPQAALVQARRHNDELLMRSTYQTVQQVTCMPVYERNELQPTFGTVPTQSYHGGKTIPNEESGMPCVSISRHAADLQPPEQSSVHSKTRSMMSQPKVFTNQMSSSVPYKPDSPAPIASGMTAQRLPTVPLFGKLPLFQDSLSCSEDDCSAKTPVTTNQSHRSTGFQPTPPPNNLGSGENWLNNSSNERSRGSPSRSTSHLSMQQMPISLTPGSQQPVFRVKTVGLRNFGSTCYMNAVLQCILHTPQLLSFLENDLRRLSPAFDAQECNGTQRYLSFFAVHKPATYSLLELGLATCHIPLGQLLLSIKGSAALYNSEFSGNGQNDAHEFLRTILYVIHDEVNRGAGRNAPYKELKDVDQETDEEGMKRWTNHIRTVDDSTIYDFFGGVLRSRCECLTCGNRSLTFDPFLDLSLPIDSQGSEGSLTHSIDMPETLDFILRRHCLNEKMEDLRAGNQLLCVKCKKLRDGKRSSIVVRWPKVLVLHIKRFNVEGKKNAAKIVYPQSFMIDAHIRYSLFAVCCHQGSESFGHYTSYVSVSKGEGETSSSTTNGAGRFSTRLRGQVRTWYLCNDSQVTEIDAKVAVAALTNVYILFYFQEG